MKQCKGDKACAWPIVKRGLCVNHLRDAMRVDSHDVLAFDETQVLSFLPARIRNKLIQKIPNVSLAK